MIQRTSIMKDGKIGYLAASGRYYCRHEDDRQIDYYTLEGEYIPLASAICLECDEIIKSERCGHFVECSCGKSFVDTDRWMPERQRYGGQAVPVTFVSDDEKRAGLSRAVLFWGVAFPLLVAGVITLTILYGQ